MIIFHLKEYFINCLSLLLSSDNKSAKDLRLLSNRFDSIILTINLLSKIIFIFFNFRITYGKIILFNEI